MYFLGYDVGSSSVKAALVDAETLETVNIAKYPENEMSISSPQPGWAEQHPEDWWNNLIKATQKLLTSTGIKGEAIISIGIAYQMHGLVLIDKGQQVLRPSIIWCDSRATSYGNEAFDQLGHNYCLENLLNTPGNFTAAKLKWVKENEPEIYNRVTHFMLPGDFMAMKMTGEVNTTIGGLSEGIFWEFKAHKVSSLLMNNMGLKEDLVPEIVPAVGYQGSLTEAAAAALGLQSGTPVGYRAGDQPNNAMALNVLKTGELAATGGTSGVIYGVTDQPLYDKQSRVNGFAHINHNEVSPSIGILLCINGAGIQYGWMRKLMDAGKDYQMIEQLASKAPIGTDGLSVLPFGNGAERIFENRNIGGHLCGLDFNRHGKSHLYRAALEGVAFAFAYGAGILLEMGLTIDRMRVGNDNLFQSNTFSNTLASLLDCEIEILDTTGAVGAARASGVGSGHLSSLEEAMSSQKTIGRIQPNADQKEIYAMAYRQWLRQLEKQLK